jgi:signal transduction histidine kinase
MLLRRLLPALLLLALSISVTYGQEYPYIHYTPKDGLVNSRIRNIYQDSRGRLFFMTTNGLSIYDGARFNNYTTETGFPDPIINDAIEVGVDSLLIASNTSRLNAWVRGRIIEIKTTDDYCPVINQFLRTSSGKLYAATDQGLYYFKDNRFIHLAIPDTAYKKTGLALDDLQEFGDHLILKGSVDINSPGGLYLFNLSTNKLDTFINRPFHSILQLPAKNELLCFETKKILAYDLAELRDGKLVPKPVASIYKSLSNTFSNKTIVDKDENVWCSQFNSITRIDPQGNDFVLDKTSGLDVNNITGLFLDREGVIWIMTDGSGLIKLANNNLEIVTGLFGKSASGISAIYASEASDTTWLHNFRDHTIYGSTPRGSFHYLLNPAIMASNLFPTPTGFYLFDDHGMYRGTFNSKHKFELNLQLVYKDTLRLNYTRAIMDKQGYIYVSGIYLAIFHDGKLTFLSKLPEFSDQICIDRHDQLWVATRSGELICYTIDRTNAKNLVTVKHNYRSVIPPLNPRSLMVDSMDNVWVGTRYDGLHCFRFKDTALAFQQHFTTHDGLTDNFIVYLNTSGNNTLWVGTQGGLDKISLKQGTFTIEGITRSNNVFEFIHTIAVSKDHRVWICGASGSTMVINDQQQNLRNNYKPQLQITSIKTPDTSIYLPSNHIQFNYDQNNLSFEAAAPSFIDEKQIMFSYLLEGSNNNRWSTPSTQASFNFINLPPGNYKLNVKAIFPVREYDSQQLVYQFSIQPPWWQTLWFKLATAMAIVLAALLIIRSYVHRKLERQRLALEKQKAIEKERTRIASDMHDDLGAGLSTIRFLGEKINRSFTNGTNRTDIEKIVANSNELVQKMNEIIWAMNEKNDSLEDLLFYTRSYAVEYCEENNLDYQIALPELLPSIFVSGEVRRNIFLTVKESLHNVVKHAAATKVEIEFNVNDSLAVRIKDDGRGFKSMPNYQGGNGLLNMKKRIEQLGGSMNLTNGDGVTLQFSVPLN